MRDRLIEILDNFGDDVSLCDVCDRPTDDCEGCKNEQLADYLLANGVIVPSCKLFDIVYLIGLDGTINEYPAVGFCQYPNGLFIVVRYGENTYSIPIEQVYFSREKAEQALKGGAE